MKIDINCDMGESYGHFTMGNDTLIFPYITSCNIACGFHGGDPLHIENTIEEALKYDIHIGAHPSYPDLVGFGRRTIKLSRSELKAVIKYQVSALKGMVESLGGELSHVKPHGALYNEMLMDEAEAATVIEAIHEIDPKLMLMGFAGSALRAHAAQWNVSFIAEAFADRRYKADGYLMPRSEEGAVIQNPEQAVQQVLSMVLNNHVETIRNTFIPIHAQSICIHGDNPAAVDILKMLTRQLNKNNIIKRKFSDS